MWALYIFTYKYIIYTYIDICSLVRILLYEDLINRIISVDWSWSIFKNTCPWKLSGSRKNIFWPFPWESAIIHYYSLLRFKSIRKSPVENQWLVNLWTWRKHRINQLAESLMGGTLYCDSQAYLISWDMLQSFCHSICKSSQEPSFLPQVSFSVKQDHHFLL